MYWPVGAPKIYAASNHELARAAKSDDKSEDPADTSDPAADGDDHGDTAENGGNAARKSDVRSPKKSSTADPSSRSVHHLALKRDEHVGGEIIGVRLGRNGHLFATIT